MDNNLLNLFVELVGQSFRQIVKEEITNALEEARQQERPEKMYTRREVCQLLHITMPTLWRRVKEGKIIAAKNGRRVLFSENEVKRYIEEGGL